MSHQLFDCSARPNAWSLPNWRIWFDTWPQFMLNYTRHQLLCYTLADTFTTFKITLILCTAASCRQPFWRFFFSSFTRWNIPDSHHGSNRNYTRTTYSSMSVGFVGRLHKCKSTRCVCTDKILSSENPIFYWWWLDGQTTRWAKHKVIHKSAH